MKLISKLIVLACLVGLGFMGLAPQVELESRASSRLHQWDRYWKAGSGPAEVVVGQGLLPTTLPGPADAAYGSQSHALRMSLKAEPGDYTLQIVFNDIAAKKPPVLEVSLNGKPVGRIITSAGQGRRPPYINPDWALSGELDLTLTLADNVLAITSVDGSFCAPAKIRLNRGVTFSPAKVGYLLLAQKKRYLVPLVAALLLALLLHLWARSGLRSALGSLVLLGLSSIFALVACEFLFREYLIRVPQARRLAVERELAGAEQQGKGYNFRTMIQPTPDPEIPYQLKPNLDGRFAGKRFKTNAHHMRSPAVEPAKASGVLRLAGLGDSVGFGWGVDQDHTYLAVLAGMLAKSTERKVEQLNFSCPSYNTAVEVAVYREKARPFSPDLAVMLFVDNDFDMPSMMLEPVQRWSLRKSYIIEQLRRALASAWQDAPVEAEAVFTSQDAQPATADARAQRKQWLARLKAYYGQGAGEAGVAAALQDWAEMLTTDGIAGVLVYHPNRLAPLSARLAKVLAQCKRLGIAALDMTEVLRAHLAQSHGSMKRDIWINPGDPHPNATGHRLMAEALARLIKERGLLKKR